MLNISWDSGFKRVYKKKVKGVTHLKEEFWEMMELFGRILLFAQGPMRYAILDLRARAKRARDKAIRPKGQPVGGRQVAAILSSLCRWQKKNGFDFTLCPMPYALCA